jgi:hypothetical protein
VSIHPVLFEVFKGDGKAAVVASAMMRQFNLDPGEGAMASQAQDLEGRRLHHFDSTRRKLSIDTVFAARAAHSEAAHFTLALSAELNVSFHRRIALSARNAR